MYPLFLFVLSSLFNMKTPGLLWWTDSLTFQLLDGGIPLPPALPSCLGTKLSTQLRHLILLRADMVLIIATLQKPKICRVTS